MKLLKITLFLGCVMLVSCIGFQEKQQQVSSFPDDQRVFKHLQLQNGLQVLLISDQDAEKAAAALAVNVGSRQDPEEFQGLAHFLEHMLFLGTEKYPEADAYQGFISSNGGSNNAYTSFEHTNYFFDIGLEHLEPALDRFAQFFIAPRFNPEYVKREVNAVASEYHARIQDDQRRVIDVLKEQVNPKHPFAKFTVGNLGTLMSQGEEVLRERLLDFYARYYSANLMSLVVVGRESIEELEQIVVPRFSLVKNQNSQLEPEQEPMFTAESLPLWISVVPQKNVRELSLNFPMPAVYSYYKSKPLSYIGNIIGHEGKNSLLSALKERGWAVGLGAGEGISFSDGAMFGIDITLTEQGLAHVDEIVALCFDTIDLIKQEGVKEWRYLEQARLGQQQFRFLTRQSASSEVVNFAASMLRYPAEDLVSAPYLMPNFEPELIKTLWQYLRPENAVIIETSPEVTTDRRSVLYDTPYSAGRISEQKLQHWKAPSVDESLGLPPVNEFITEDFTLINDDSGATVPRRLIDDSGVELWYLNDDTYNVPKGSLSILLSSNFAGQSSEERALSDIWSRMVADQLNEFSYAADLAGLDFGVSSSWRGIEINLSGFNEKQQVLLKTLLAALRQPEYVASRFERLQAERIRALENLKQLPPYRLLTSELNRVLSLHHGSLDDYIDATRSITLAGVEQHVNKVLSSIELRMLAYGNYSQKDAEVFAKILAESLNVENYTVTDNTQNIVKLPKKDLVRVVPSEHNDASVVLYMQGNKVDKQERVALGLAAQILRPLFYNDLRTEKQLGYIVSAWPNPIRDVPGIVFVVQSPVADAAMLQQEIRQFLAAWLETSISDEQFQENKRALLAKLNEAPKNLWEAGARFWGNLTFGYENFDSRAQLITALQSLEKEQWLAIVHDILNVDQARSLWLLNWGKSGEKPVKGDFIEALDDFKWKQELYLFQ